MADNNEHRERLKELEEKKKRLAELRARKMARQKEDGRLSIMSGDCAYF